MIFLVNVPTVKRSPLIDSQARVVRPLSRPLPMVQRCIHHGVLLDRTNCGLEVYACNLHKGICGWQQRATERWCEKCTDYATAAPRSLRFDHTNLTQNFNGSLIEDTNGNGGYILAYRSKWGNAEVEVVRLDSEYKVVSDPVRLNLNHEQARAGREDPRLFRHKGRLHIWYTGWMGRTRQWNKANVLFARLNDETLQVEDIFHPNIPNRNSWEKNHSYFDINNELYMVYSIAPHKVMKVLCTDVIGTWETPTRTTWGYGHLRGGASPVLHNGEYYHFFHGCIEPDGKRLYSIGVAVFEAAPPFRITRITQQPLDVAYHRPGGGIEVLFPCGAFFKNGHWVVSMGVDDSHTEVRFYPEEWVEKLLEAV